MTAFQKPFLKYLLARTQYKIKDNIFKLDILED